MCACMFIVYVYIYVYEYVCIYEHVDVGKYISVYVCDIPGFNHCEKRVTALNRNALIALNLQELLICVGYSELEEYMQW